MRHALAKISNVFACSIQPVDQVLLPRTIDEQTSVITSTSAANLPHYRRPDDDRNNWRSPATCQMFLLTYLPRLFLTSLVSIPYQSSIRFLIGFHAVINTPKVWVLNECPSSRMYLLIELLDSPRTEDFIYLTHRGESSFRRIAFVILSLIYF